MVNYSYKPIIIFNLFFIFTLACYSSALEKQIYENKTSIDISKSDFLVDFAKKQVKPLILYSSSNGLVEITPIINNSNKAKLLSHSDYFHLNFINFSGFLNKENSVKNKELELLPNTSTIDHIYSITSDGNDTHLYHNSHLVNGLTFAFPQNDDVDHIMSIVAASNIQMGGNGSLVSILNANNSILTQDNSPNSSTLKPLNSQFNAPKENKVLIVLNLPEKDHLLNETNYNLDVAMSSLFNGENSLFAMFDIMENGTALYGTAATTNKIKNDNVIFAFDDYQIFDIDYHFITLDEIERIWFDSGSSYDADSMLVAGQILSWDKQFFRCPIPSITTDTLDYFGLDLNFNQGLIIKIKSIYNNNSFGYGTFNILFDNGCILDCTIINQKYLIFRYREVSYSIINKEQKEFLLSSIGILDLSNADMIMASFFNYSDEDISPIEIEKTEYFSGDPSFVNLNIFTIYLKGGSLINCNIKNLPNDVHFYPLNCELFLEDLNKNTERVYSGNKKFNIFLSQNGLGEKDIYFSPKNDFNIINIGHIILFDNSNYKKMILSGYGSYIPSRLFITSKGYILIANSISINELYEEIDNSFLFQNLNIIFLNQGYPIEFLSDSDLDGDINRNLFINYLWNGYFPNSYISAIQKEKIIKLYNEIVYEVWAYSLGGVSNPESDTQFSTYPK